MEIAGDVTNIRTTAGNAAVSSGALWLLNSTTYPNATVQRSDYSYWTDLRFRASGNWTGVTSKGRNAANTADIIWTDYNGSDGQASKPATIACMWILRFK